MLPKDNTDDSCAQMHGGKPTTNVLTQQLTIRNPLVVLESRRSGVMSNRLDKKESIVVFCRAYPIFRFLVNLRLFFRGDSELLWITSCTSQPRFLLSSVETEEPGSSETGC